MLLQTNSYLVPKEKRMEHARLMRRFRQALAQLGCDQFEVYEQVAANWASSESNGRFVQIMRFRDRKEQLAVQNAERNDPVAQGLINEFCQLIDFPTQQQQGQFATGFYRSVLPVVSTRVVGRQNPPGPGGGAEGAGEAEVEADHAGEAGDNGDAAEGSGEPAAEAGEEARLPGEEPEDAQT